MSQTMPLTRFLFAAHFCKKTSKKSSSANISKTTPARNLIFFCKRRRRKESSKKENKKNCKIFDVSFLQHTVEAFDLDFKKARKAKIASR